VTPPEPGATGTPPPIDPPTPPAGADGEATAPASAVDDTRFAHASEAEMARILDFYEVRWEYEPTTFPILWNLDGDVVESFAPDFYLPELDVFLEMTTLKQRLVRKKNRKLRRLRELYPDIRIKLFYARDFRAMMLKYGRLGLAESLSGTPGQVVPERAAVEVPSDEGATADGAPLPGPRPLAEDGEAPLPAVLVQDAEGDAATAAGAATRPGTRNARARHRRGPRRRATSPSAAIPEGKA
jgi:hypoxanthine phosphoribosyltransferase